MIHAYERESPSWGRNSPVLFRLVAADMVVRAEDLETGSTSGKVCRLDTGLELRSVQRNGRELGSENVGTDELRMQTNILGSSRPGKPSACVDKFVGRMMRAGIVSRGVVRNLVVCV